MIEALLPWVLLTPLISATVLLCWRRIPEAGVTLLGVGSIFIAAALTALIAINFEGQPQTVHGWQWMVVEHFAPRIAFYLDGLSLSMMGVITGVGALIHLFAAGYMAGDPGYRRFFAYMNGFVAAMLLLVLGDNLVSLFFGWEGVGLCSYLLIGFFYQDADNGWAARKAFITTRVGDTLMAIGLFLMFRELGTLDIQAAMYRAEVLWPQGSGMVTAIALLLLGGAVGKSAQLPLQTWLPDAMAGPTPVSALIHAATMVTAGVYLIARTHELFLLSPLALNAVAWVGALSLLLAAGAALVQTDIKRVLAYSTMSQIGYMFLALGVGAFSAAIFHLMTHAFFKALLFLAAGYVIHALHHEQNIYRMGGLRKAMPLAWGVFLIGGGALAAVPWITAGFWSKDLILWKAWQAGEMHFFAIGLVGAALTAFYTFRMIFIAFEGEAKTEVHEDRSLKMRLPLGLLAVLSVLGGLIGLPLAGVLPDGPMGGAHRTELLLQFLAAGVSLGAIALAWKRYGSGQLPLPPQTAWRQLAQSGWGFDGLYERLFIRSWMGLARINKPDWADKFFDGVVLLIRGGHHASIVTQTGQLRWYAAGFAGGMIFLLGVVLWA